jgi:hypothetical protein
MPGKLSSRTLSNKLLSGAGGVPVGGLVWAILRPSASYIDMSASGAKTVSNDFPWKDVLGDAAGVPALPGTPPVTVYQIAKAYGLYFLATSLGIWSTPNPLTGPFTQVYATATNNICAGDDGTVIAFTATSIAATKDGVTWVTTANVLSAASLSSNRCAGLGFLNGKYGALSSSTGAYYAGITIDQTTLAATVTVGSGSANAPFTSIFGNSLTVANGVFFITWQRNDSSPSIGLFTSTNMGAGGQTGLFNLTSAPGRRSGFIDDNGDFYSPGVLNVGGTAAPTLYRIPAGVTSPSAGAYVTSPPVGLYKISKMDGVYYGTDANGVIYTTADIINGGWSQLMTYPGSAGAPPQELFTLGGNELIGYYSTTAFRYSIAPVIGSLVKTIPSRRAANGTILKPWLKVA